MQTDSQPSPGNERPHFDVAVAASLVGKSVLVGLTYCNHAGEIVERRQIHGVVRSADAKRGVAVQLSGSRSGEIFGLPPDLRSFEPAPPGEYRLKSTGEVVVNPDYLATWIIDMPRPKRRWWKFW